MKITDMQAACGVGQLSKLEGFIKKRQENFLFLKKNLEDLQEYLLLPEAEVNSEPSWFGFVISLKKKSKIKRRYLIQKLTENKIGTRLLFAGNLTKQPSYLNKKFRISGNLKNTDFIMENTFWVGLHPALGEEELNFVTKTIKDCFK